jgi:hypothetical protein
LTVVHDAGGFVGGYLVTNCWGRPIEFRLTTAVQPNRVQQILYGVTLQPYVCAELIGKTLVEKTAMPAQLVLTDREPVLDLRKHVPVPVACVWTVAGLSGECAKIPMHHPGFPSDGPFIRQVLERLDGNVDLAEPFVRIRDAIAEARRMGVTARG